MQNKNYILLKKLKFFIFINYLNLSHKMNNKKCNEKCIHLFLIYFYISRLDNNRETIDRNLGTDYVK